MSANQQDQWGYKTRLEKIGVGAVDITRKGAAVWAPRPPPILCVLCCIHHVAIDGVGPLGFSGQNQE